MSVHEGSRTTVLLDRFGSVLVSVSSPGEPRGWSVDAELKRRSIDQPVSPLDEYDVDVTTIPEWLRR